jgi:hypothetical protein
MAGLDYAAFVAAARTRYSLRMQRAVTVPAEIRSGRSAAERLGRTVNIYYEVPECLDEERSARGIYQVRAGYDGTYYLDCYFETVALALVERFRPDGSQEALESLQTGAAETPSALPNTTPRTQDSPGEGLRVMFMSATDPKVKVATTDTLQVERVPLLLARGLPKMIGGYYKIVDQSDEATIPAKRVLKVERLEPLGLAIQMYCVYLRSLECNKDATAVVMKRAWRTLELTPEVRDDVAAEAGNSTTRCWPTRSSARIQRLPKWSRSAARPFCQASHKRPSCVLTWRRSAAASIRCRNSRSSDHGRHREGKARDPLRQERGG